MDKQDLLVSLRNLDRLYERAGFNDAAKFGVLRNAVVRHPDLAQFAAYRGALTYDALHTAVQDYATSKVTFGQTSHSYSPEVAPQQEDTLSTDQSMASKVDELADQLKDLTLLIKGMRKPEKTVEIKQDDRVCSYCRKPGHTANRCESNPHRNTRCSNCNKIGHSAATCWSAKRENGQKAPSTLATAQSESQAEMRLQAKETPSPVSFVGVVNDEDVVATTKRTAEGEPLPKQPRGEGPQTMSELTRTTIQPTSRPPSVPTIGETQQKMLRTYGVPKAAKKPKNKRKERKSKKESIQEHVGKYNVITEFANAPAGLTFGQLVRGDAIEAVKMIRKLLGRGMATTASADLSSGPIPTRVLRKVNVRVYGTTCSALLDSGAVPNIMSLPLAELLSLSPKDIGKKIRVADGSISRCVGVLTDIPVAFDNIVVPTNFLVVSSPPCDLLLGVELMNTLKASIDFGRQTLQISYEGERTKLNLEPDYLKIPPLPSDSEDGTDSEDFTSDSDTTGDEGGESSDEEFVLTVAQEPPYEPDTVSDADTSQDLPGHWERATLNDSYTARGDNKESNKDLAFDPVNVCVTQETPIESTSNKSHNRTPPSLKEGEIQDEIEKEDQMHELLARLAHLPRKAQEELFQIIQSLEIAAWSFDDLRPSQVPYHHSFDLEDNNPIHFRSRRAPPIHQKVIREQVDKMLEAGIITPSVSAWSFPVVIATKKGGTYRFCVDYRTLNAKMKADKWPLPKIEEIFDDLQGSTYFSTLDLFSGYWQVRLSEPCKEKTTFVCRYGTYKFEVMPFGLMNAPSTFQRMMDDVFRNLEFVRVYLVDVIVFSPDLDSHLVRLRAVFNVLSHVGLKLKISKCSFAHSAVRLLGHIVNHEGLQVDPEKTAIIQEMKVPTNKTELRSFLGLAGYYRRFIKGFAQISATLHEATSRTKPFIWTHEMTSSFNDLKNRLVSPPILAMPNFSLPFVVETDASNVAVGAVLAQTQEDGKVHPVQYASRTMSAAERKYSACEREALAVVFALRKFRVYLLSDVPFVVVTDHHALSYAFKKKDIHGRLARWMDFLAEYEFTVQYRPGTENTAADFLSRQTDGARAKVLSDMDEGDLALAFAPEIEEPFEDLEPFCQEVARYLLGYQLVETDANKRKSIRRAAKNFLIWDDGLFRRTPKGPRAIPTRNARPALLRCFHDDIGHWDVATTKQFILDRFWWPDVHRDIHLYVRSCHDCQVMKPIPAYHSTLHIPLTHLFDVFSIDFAGPLPKTKNGNQYVLIAVEHLTGWPMACPTRDSTSSAVIEFLQNHLIHAFGPPSSIISDNATCFAADATREFLAHHGIKWRPVLAYAPMSNGRAERMVGTIKRSLGKTAYRNRKKWDEEVPFVVYGYRRRQMSEGFSPFELMYGVPPRMQGNDAKPLLNCTTDAHRELELMAVTSARAARVVRQRLSFVIPTPTFRRWSNTVAEYIVVYVQTLNVLR